MQTLQAPHFPLTAPTAALDAVVFLNVDHLLNRFGPASIQEVDMVTGQVVFPDDCCVALRQVVAWEHRLGEAYEIAELREKLAPVFSGRASVLLERVLGQECQAGGYLPLELLPCLRDELAQVHRCIDDPQVNELVDAFTWLANAAEGEGNPIVFV